MTSRGAYRLPINGTASDVVGIFSATKFRNTVNDRSIVTPEKLSQNETLENYFDLEPATLTFLLLFFLN